MRGKFMLYVDQYGDRVAACTVRELRDQVGTGKVSRMYRDKKDGKTCHVGYVVGHRWFTAYVPYEREA